MLLKKFQIASFYLLLICFYIPYGEIQAQSQQTYQSLQEALFTQGQLAGQRGPQNVTWIEDGKRYSYMQTDPSTQTTEIRAYDPESGEDNLIFSTADITFPEDDNPFEFQSFQWSADFKFLVFQTNFTPIYRYSGNSDYYTYSIEDEQLRIVAEDAFTAQLSPDGKKVAYHKHGELYIHTLETGQEDQLTFDSETNLFNGRFGWVYEEEFGKVQAWSWSPDSRYIAFWQTDERHVNRFISTDYEGSTPEYTDIPYPKVGDENPHVKIGVIDSMDGSINWMDTQHGDGLIPRIYWTNNPEKLAVVVLNREQNHLKLQFHDINNGEGELIMEEHAKQGWIDVFDFFAGIDDYLFFPENRNEFLWISDRDGWKHLYRYNYDGDLINQVTRGDWRVTNVYAVNSEEGRIYYESTEQSPLERHLYSISFDGKEKVQHSKEPGRHSFSMSPDGNYYIDTWSNVHTPVQVELWTTEKDGHIIEKLEQNQAVTERLERFFYAPRELFQFTKSDGQKLDGYLIKPENFDPDSTYPLLLNIYGGPGAQGVYNQFETNGWIQFLAQEGYVIANVNNRGSGGYSRDFEKMVYKKLGEMEAHDFAETAKYLAEKPWIDGNRMAIRGHSYGGYMSALTMVLQPEVFHVAIVGAPVTDWRLYDTIYTERYMGLLDDNLEGYINSSVMKHASNLNGNMLVAHSSMDENVHIQNTMQMIRAFTDAMKDVDLRIYPPGAHGVAYNRQSYVLLHQVYTRYLNSHLK